MVLETPRPLPDFGVEAAHPGQYEVAVVEGCPARATVRGNDTRRPGELVDALSLHGERRRTPALRPLPGEARRRLSLAVDARQSDIRLHDGIHQSRDHSGFMEVTLAEKSSGDWKTTPTTASPSLANQ
jgi:hypothetical protein